MSDIQLNVNYRNDIKATTKANSSVSVSLPNINDEEDDSSNNSKKSKKFLFNKVQTSSPKLEKSFGEMSINEKIKIFQQLSKEDKLDLLQKNYKNILSYVNSLSDDKKSEFITNFQAKINGKNLSQSDKNTLSGLINVSPDSSNSSKDSDDGINNIMMILVKAFVNNMNAESFDELEKVFEANLINTFLQNVQKQMQKNIKSQQKLADNMSSKGWTTGDTIAAILAVVVVVVTILSLFFPPAEICSIIWDASTDLIASAPLEVTDEAMSWLADTSDLENTDSVLEPKYDADGLPNLQLPEEDEGFLSEDSSETQAQNSKQANIDKNQVKTNEIKSEEQKNITKDENDIGKAQSGEDNTDDIKKKQDKTKTERLKEALNPFKNDFSTKIVDGVPENLSGKEIFAKIGKRLLSAGIAGGVTFGGGYTLDNVIDPKGQQKQQNEISIDQQEVSASTNASDILNNQEQQAAKRINDDSEKISQSSGYVQQAINMIGTAMSFKV